MGRREPGDAAGRHVCGRSVPHDGRTVRSDDPRCARARRLRPFVRARGAEGDRRACRRLRALAACGLGRVDIDVDAAACASPRRGADRSRGARQGLAADLVSRGLVDRGARTALVSLGGDMRARGEPPAGGWRVPVEHPLDPSAPAFVHPLAGGALVSSTRRIRVWERGGREYHHIIDPRTGDSTRTPIVAVVAAAGDAWWAEGIAKAIMIAGVDDGSVLAQRDERSGVDVHGRRSVRRGRAVITIAGAVDSKLAWYAARSSGLVAWAVVTASIVCGLVVSTRLIRRKGVPAWFLDLHKFLSTLTVLFVAVHLLALWADDFVYFGPRELFVPMASSYRPGRGGLGPGRVLSPRRDPADVVEHAVARPPGVARGAPHELSPVRVRDPARVHLGRRQHQRRGAMGRAATGGGARDLPRHVPAARRRSGGPPARPATSRGGRGGGRRAPCRRSGSAGSTRPRATRTTRA